MELVQNLRIVIDRDNDGELCASIVFRSLRRGHNRLSHLNAHSPPPGPIVFAP